MLHPAPQALHHRRKADDLVEHVRPQRQAVDSPLAFGELHRRLPAHPVAQPRVIVLAHEQPLKLFEVAPTALGVKDVPQYEKTLRVELEIIRQCEFVHNYLSPDCCPSERASSRT